MSEFDLLMKIFGSLAATVAVIVGIYKALSLFKNDKATSANEVTDKLLNDLLLLRENFANFSKETHELNTSQNIKIRELEKCKDELKLNNEELTDKVRLLEQELEILKNADKNR
jgi:hypothetical protein